jgi:hypothetical protein
VIKKGFKVIKRILEVAEMNFKEELERFEKEGQGKMDVEGSKKRKRKSKK